VVFLDGLLRYTHRHEITVEEPGHAAEPFAERSPEIPSAPKPGESTNPQPNAPFRMKPETVASLKAAQSGRKVARVLLLICLTNFFCFLVTFSLIFYNGDRVDRSHAHDRYVLVNKGSYSHVAPTAYIYVKAHEALTMLLFLVTVPVAALSAAERYAASEKTPGYKGTL